jgi:hypothetical protein
MIQEHLLIGRITGLQIFNLPEFGTRATFRLACLGQYPVTCCVAGAVARELVTFYCEGDKVAVSGVYEPRPSTASSKAPWAGRFRVRALVVEASIELGERQRTPPQFMRPELCRGVPDRHERVPRLRCSGLATVLSLSALVFLAGAAMAQVKEISPPTLSSRLREAPRIQTQTIEKLRQRPTAESPSNAVNLVPIESIGAGSDIRPFLAPGVPADLTRAALRRAWSADPAIRDFIGLSENSWDFNGPDGVPGFDPLTTDGPGRLLARKTEEANSLDPERLAADRLTHDHLPVSVGEALPAPSSSQVK